MLYLIQNMDLQATIPINVDCDIAFYMYMHVLWLFAVNDSIGRERGEPPGADSSGDHHGSSSVDNAQPSTSAFTPVIRSSRPQQMRPDSSTMVATCYAATLFC